jgi:hypothetical protein
VTEAEWLSATDPTPMLEFVRGRLSDRKLRLYTVACNRKVWDFLRDERSRRAIEAGELYADGKLDAASLDAALTNATKALRDVQRPIRKGGRPDRQGTRAIPALVCARLPAWPLQSEQVLATVIDSVRQLTNEDMSGLLCLIRDIVGNPFGPVTADPAWLTSTVVTLAAGVYSNRAFDRMPILADALQDAGCDDADVLGHCRSEGPHVRGCWVVDLLLGKG